MAKPLIVLCSALIYLHCSAVSGETQRPLVSEENGGYSYWIQDDRFKLEREIKLKVHPRFVLVRLPALPKIEELDQWAKKILDAQAKASSTKPDDKLLDELLRKHPPSLIPGARGVLVPRLEGLRDDAITALADSLLRQKVAQSLDIVFEWDDERPLVPLGTISVGLRGKAAIETVRTLEKLGLKQAGEKAFSPSVLFFEPLEPERSRPRPLFDLVEYLRSKMRDSIEWVEPDFAFQPIHLGQPKANRTSCNDPDFPRQWYLNSPSNPKGGIDIENAWKHAKARANSRRNVALLDDGIDAEHIDLKGRVTKAELDFLEQPAAPYGHATACAGIICALTDNKEGIAGIVPSCNLLSLRLFGKDRNENPTFASNKNFAKALTSAAQMSAEGGVICCAFSIKETNLFRRAIEHAVMERDCVIVAAAGNHRPKFGAQRGVAFPASNEYCVAVGAVDEKGKLWDYSCRGITRGLVAPSADIGLKTGGMVTTDFSGAKGYDRGDYTDRFGGTSGATAIVVGVAALVRATYPTLAASDVRKALENSGDRASKPDKEYGHGLVNAAKALQLAEKKLPGKKGPTNAERRLKVVLNPKAEYYLIREGPNKWKRIELRPNKKLVAVFVGKDQLEERSFFWSAVDPCKFDPRKDGSEAIRVEGKVAYLVPCGCLRNLEALEDAARKATLPEMMPVYESDGIQLVPLGTLTLRLEKLDMEHQKALQQFASEHNLKKLNHEDDLIQLTLPIESPFDTVFQAAQRLSEQRFVRWCEPDFAMRHEAQPP